MVRETLIFQAILYVYYNKNWTQPTSSSPILWVCFQNHFTRGQEAHLTDNGCFLLVSLQTKITKFLCKHKSENHKLGEESQNHKKLWAGRDPKAQLVRLLWLKVLSLSKLEHWTPTVCSKRQPTNYQSSHYYTAEWIALDCFSPLIFKTSLQKSLVNLMNTITCCIIIQDYLHFQREGAVAYLFSRRVTSDCKCCSFFWATSSCSSTCSSSSPAEDNDCPFKRSSKALHRNSSFNLSTETSCLSSLVQGLSSWNSLKNKQHPKAGDCWVQCE